jgi:two-component system NtrC family response regulator
LSREALRALEEYSWPGNVRELQHALDHAAVRANGSVIESWDLPPEIVRSRPLVNWRAPPRPLDMSLTEASAAVAAAVEREWLLAELSRHRTRAAVAQALRINLRTLYDKLTRQGLRHRIE